MLKKVVLILTSLLGSGTLVPGQGSISEIEKMLGSDDFEIRREAMETLWKEGKISLEVLERLSRGSDPEIKARALSLHRKLLLGLSPDTPQEIMDLLDKYFSASVNGKVSLFNSLQSSREYGLMLRLRSIEKDERVLEKMDEIVAEVLPKVQLSLLRAGDLNQAKELLLLNHDHRSLIAYAGLCDHLGQLDGEIGRLRQLGDEQSKARYLACLRVKGDPAILRAEAARLGDDHAVMVASLAMGDVAPLFEYLDEEGSLSLVEGYYLDWIRAEKIGDKNRMERRLASISHHVADSSESFEARSSLLKMGMLDEVLRGYANDFVDESRYFFLLGQDRDIEALKLIGLEEAVLKDGWIKGVYARTLERFRVEGDVEPYFEFFYAASFFESRGMVDEAAKCIESYFDAAREAKDSRMYDWYQRSFSYAPHASLVALDREVKKFDVEVEALLSSIYGESDGVEWLKVKLLDKADNRSPLEVLQLVASFYGEPIVPVDFFEGVEKRFREESLAEQDPEVGLKHLLDFANNRGEGSDILLYCRLLKEAEFGLNPLFEAEHFANKESYEEAAKLYAASNYLQSPSATPSMVYRAGVVLNKTGDPLGEAYLKKGILLSQGVAANLGYFAKHHFRAGEYEKSREFYRAALLRMERVDLSDDSNLRSIIEGALSGAIQERNWSFALALSELESWALKQASDVYLIRGRFQVLFCRGMLAAEEGLMEEALSNLREAHSLIPRDGVLADDFFPALREAGLVKLHDELFEKSAELLRENVRFFSRDHNAKNTFGWLASRANRCLDEAEGYLKMSLEVRPLSEAYLDTMAEIYFAKGDREKAVEWSDRAANQDSSDSQLRQQNRRFRNDPFPLK